LRNWPPHPGQANINSRSSALPWGVPKEKSRPKPALSLGDVETPGPLLGERVPEGRRRVRGRPAILLMSLATSISRLADYYRRHGLWATIQRFRLAARRALFSGRMVLFYCDLSKLSAPPPLPSFLRIERKGSEVELSSEDLQKIVSIWNPKLARRYMQERFGKGASLWLIKSDDHLAGYGWTLQGQTIEPHYFRLTPNDVHLFDFHVLDVYRGQGLNPLLVSYILSSLAARSVGRAFIEAAAWNQPQLSSLAKTPFHPLGSARKTTVLGHSIVFWDEKRDVTLPTPLLQAVKPRSEHGRGQALPMARQAGRGK
jgi:GNAT superfamily N-acetyltransferase